MVEYQHDGGEGVRLLGKSIWELGELRPMCRTLTTWRFCFQGYMLVLGGSPAGAV